MGGAQESEGRRRRRRGSEVRVHRLSNAAMHGSECGTIYSTSGGGGTGKEGFF